MSEETQNETESKLPVKLIQGIFKLNSLDLSEARMTEEVALKAIAEIKPFLTMGRVLGTYDLQEEITQVPEDKAATRVTNIYCEGDYVLAEVELLDNELGAQMLEDLRAGQGVALEAIGFAEVDDANIVQNYHFLTVNVAKV